MTLNLNEQIGKLKELLEKITPQLGDIEIKTVEVLDDLAMALSMTRLCPRSLVVPAVVLAIQEYVGINSPDTYGIGLRGKVAKMYASKNIKNIPIKICEALPKLEQQEVEEAVKRGCKTWLNKVFEENNVTL